MSLRWVHMPLCWFCHEAAQDQDQDSLLVKCRNDNYSPNGGLSNKLDSFAELIIFMI